MILLAIMPPWGKPTVPLGLGCLSQFLTIHDIEHKILDLNLDIYQRLDADLRHLWLPQYLDHWMHPEKFNNTKENLEQYIEWAVDEISRLQFSMIGFSVNLANRRISVEIAKRLRQRCPDKTIVFGGLGVYIYGERSLIPDGIVDFFVMGEGEATLLDLVLKESSGRSLTNTIGTITNPKEHSFSPRLPVDLSKHFWPTYEKFKVDQYPMKEKSMPIILGRGCVNKCSFCGDFPFWGKYRNRQAVNVVDEIEHHIKNYGMHTFTFNDLAINSNPKILEEMCDLIIERKLDIEWSSYAYLKNISDSLIKKMRDSGCTMLCFGLESGSNAILKRMNKFITAEKSSKNLTQISSGGILCNIGLMVGFPYETEEEFQETIVFLKKNKDYIHEISSISSFYVKPLSPVELNPDKYGITFPENPNLRWNHWEGEDGSCYEKRVEKVWRLANFIEKSPIKFCKDNIHGL